MEQAADRAETAVVDHYFCHQLKTFSSILPMDTGKQTDDCFVMCRLSPRRWRNVICYSWSYSPGAGSRYRLISASCAEVQQRVGSSNAEI